MSRRVVFCNAALHAASLKQKFTKVSVAATATSRNGGARSQVQTGNVLTETELTQKSAGEPGGAFSETDRFANLLGEKAWRLRCLFGLPNDEATALELHVDQKRNRNPDR